jgi:hypothetical protein
VGDSNLSTIDQDAGRAGENANLEATVNQEGLATSSAITQIDDDNIAVINQVGLGNASTVSLDGSMC